ncbi:aminotransferase class I/II-fold pyridoxal phosphate-dependent enzyme [archaeon]|nr:aminotransferase class I/II-fold pyridoxal phosphate-dependent enzyme [archaeon]
MQTETDTQIKSAKEVINDIETLTEKHNKWRKEECINLIASENVTSSAVDNIYISDLGHRYAEGKPFQRHYQGLQYIDQIEDLTQKLARNLFNAKHVDLRPLSGTTANLSALGALTNYGDTIFSSSIPNGGHVSHTRHGVSGLIGIKDLSFPFNIEEMNIDIDKTKKKIEEKQPKVLLFGASLFLFPHPVKEIAEFAKTYDIKIIYDAAHVLGLIAGKRFQDPLKEGAEIITSSTHKTFPGPQSGIIFGNSDKFDKIETVVFPQVICNHHLHKLPAMAVALEEMTTHGQSYANQIITNAKTLAQSMHELGFNVVAEKLGFTESHQVVVDVSNLGGGKTVAEHLESQNIILNKNFIPGDKINTETMRNPRGIRIGTQEMTRMGMKEDEMQEIAKLLKKSLIDKKDIKQEVTDFKKEFLDVKYC